MVVFPVERHDVRSAFDLCAYSQPAFLSERVTMSWFSRRQPSCRRVTNVGNWPVAAEVLTPRTMLSGNVSLSISGAKLEITGDNQDNDISIAIDRSNQVIIATGYNGTTINGETSMWFDGSNVKRVRLDMASGHDDVYVDCGAAPIGMELDPLVDFLGDLGDGNDSFTMVDLQFIDWVTVNGGNGDDYIAVEHVGTGHNIRVRGEKGDDELGSYGNDVGRNLIMSGGPGADYATGSYTYVGQTMRALAGSGSMWGEFSDLYIERDIYFNGGKEADLFGMIDSYVGVNVNISTGGGDDVVGLAFGNEVGEKTRVQTGSGDDYVHIGNQFGDNNLFHGRLWVNNKGGNDAVLICGYNTYEGDILLIGGAGSDDILGIEQMQNVAQPPVIRRFEEVGGYGYEFENRAYEIAGDLGAAFASHSLDLNVSFILCDPLWADDGMPLGA